MKTFQRIMRILKLISENFSGLTFTEINEIVDLPKSSLSQLLDILLEYKILKLDDYTNKYSIGIYFWELASQNVGNVTINQMIQASYPYLEEFKNKYDQTIQMSFLEGDDVIYIAKVMSKYPIQLTSQVGSRLPAYTTGMGKVLLAHLTEEQILDLYPNESLKPYTENTITSRKELFDRIQRIYSEGYAIDRGEYTSEISCIAVPVFGFYGYPVAAISVSMLGEDRLMKEKDFWLNALSKYAKKLSNIFGSIKPIDNDTKWEMKQ